MQILASWVCCGSISRDFFPIGSGHTESLVAAVATANVLKTARKKKRQKVLEIPYRKYINNNDLVACRYVQNAEKIALLSRDRSDSESTLSKDCTMGPIKNSRNSFKSCPKYFQTVSIFHFLTCVLIKSIFCLFLFTYIYKLKNSDTTSKRLRNTLWELLDKAHHQELIF